MSHCHLKPKTNITKGIVQKRRTVSNSPFRCEVITPVITLVDVTADVSSIPIVDDNDSLVDIYSRRYMFLFFRQLRTLTLSWMTPFSMIFLYHFISLQ